jgi:hypothetical protein
MVETGEQLDAVKKAPRPAPADNSALTDFRLHSILVLHEFEQVQPIEESVDSQVVSGTVRGRAAACGEVVPVGGENAYSDHAQRPLEEPFTLW